MAMMIEELEVSCFQVSSEPALVIVTALLSYYSHYLRHDGNVRKLASEAARTDGEFECEWSYWIFGG